MRKEIRKMTTGRISGKVLSGTVAAFALIAGLGGPVMAQTAAPSATAQSDLPAPLAALNLGNLRSEVKRDGLREIDGRTSDGVEIEAKIDMAGNIIEVEADDGALPQSLIEALLPGAALGSDAMSLLARIDEIKLRPDHIDVKGNQPDGADAELKFDPQGALVGAELDDAALPDALVQALLPQAVRDADVFSQFGRIDEIGSRNGHFIVKGEDASGRDMGAAFDQEGRVLRFGSDGPRKGGHDHHGRDRDDDRRGDDRRGGPGHAGRGGPDGHPARGPRLADFNAVEVNQRLTAAGYSQFGFLRPQGPRIVLEATNPQGEPVVLELDRAGEVVRETAR